MARIIKAMAQQLSKEESRQEFWSTALDIASALAATAAFILALQFC
ncbi:MAG: hypothetical protein K2F69_04055 [Bacteroidaceae bacterium]|nr:hypothetical protein [Bacteroidaceae bacterium]